MARDHTNEQGASVVSSTHEQNSICSQKKMNDIAHEHTIICRQLFAGHVVGSRPMKRKKHLHRMIIRKIKHLCYESSKYISLKRELSNPNKFS